MLNAYKFFRKPIDSGFFFCYYVKVMVLSRSTDDIKGFCMQTEIFAEFT